MHSAMQSCEMHAYHGTPPYFSLMPQNGQAIQPDSTSFPQFGHFGLPNDAPQNGQATHPGWTALPHAGHAVPEAGCADCDC